MVASPAAATNAAPDPKPPFEIPAKTTAAAAMRKNSKLSNDDLFRITLRLFKTANFAPATP